MIKVDNMKKMICLLLVGTMCILSTGCSAREMNTAETLYVMEDCEEPVKPYIILFQTEKRFTFSPSVVSSYIACGEYKIENNVLTLMATDGNLYVFEMQGDSLVFDEKNSSEIAKYDGFATPKQHAIFKLENAMR